MKLWSTLSIATLAAAVSTQAAAGFRCGFNSIVQKGDSKAKVIVICGKPEFRDVVVGPGSEILREMWSYRDYPDRKWMTTLHFTSGIVTRIESLGRID